MKNVSLIEVFENKPVQDVGTFNSIFKLTPIMGFPFNTEVEIQELSAGDERKIIVGESTIFLNINQFAVPKQKKKEQPPRVQLKKVAKNTNKNQLPNVFKMLNPSEFMVYEAIKFFQYVDGIEELSKELNLSRRTIYTALKKLSSAKLVYTEKVSLNGKPLLRLHLIQ